MFPIATWSKQVFILINVIIAWQVLINLNYWIHNQKINYMINNQKITDTILN